MEKTAVYWLNIPDLPSILKHSGDEQTKDYDWYIAKTDVKTKR